MGSTILPAMTGTDAKPRARVLKKRDWFERNDFPIEVLRREPQEPFGPHSHEFTELVIITGGGGLHVVDRESHPLTAGDVFVISGATVHEYRELKDLCLINVMFDWPRLKISPRDLVTLPGYHALFGLEAIDRRARRFQSRMHLPLKELATVVDLAGRLEHEVHAGEPGFGFASSALLMRMICFLSRNYDRAALPSSHALLRIGKAVARLEEHFDQPMTVEQLARIAGMPRRSFLRAFREATGQTPINYLLQLRISRAAELLGLTDESITEIAFRCGFEDSNYFTRQFRRVREMTPREYRQRHRIVRGS